MTTSLARIPFSARDEARIGSAARWMQFIAVFQIICSCIALAVLLIFASVGSLFGTTLLEKFREAAAQANAQGELNAVLGESIGLILIVAAVVALIGIGIQLWASMILHRAGESFKQVALTDEADQAFLAEGFGNLRRFFHIEAVFAVVGAIGALMGAFGAGGVG